MIAPPLVSGNNNNGNGGRSDSKSTTTTTNVIQVPTSRPRLAAQSSWRSNYTRKSSQSTSSTRSSTLAAMMEMDNENDLDLSNSGSASLDGMVVMMENMLEGKLSGGHLDGMDASARSGPL